MLVFNIKKYLLIFFRLVLASDGLTPAHSQSVLGSLEKYYFSDNSANDITLILADDYAMWCKCQNVLVMHYFKCDDVIT